MEGRLNHMPPFLRKEEKMEKERELPCSLETVLRYYGLVVRRGRAVCPFCGGKDSLSVGKDQYHCFKCNASGNAITFVRQQEHIAQGVMKRLYEIAGAPCPIVSPTALANEPIEGTAKTAPPEVLDQTLRELFALLHGLSPKHEAAMKARGFWTTPPYATFHMKNEECERICRVLISKGCQLKGVPGFYMKQDGSWTMTLAGLPGFLVPYISMDGKYQGVQKRLDDDARKKKDGSERPRYMWWSTRFVPKDGKPETGTPSQAYVHFACEREETFDGKLVPKFKNGTVFLTEGALKADLAHQFTEQCFMAVPGVNARNLLSPVLKELKKIGVRRVVLAFDMDYEVNEHVKDALDQTRALIKEEGFAYNHLKWDTQGVLKGVDDYYAFWYATVKSGLKEFLDSGSISFEDAYRLSKADEEAREEAVLRLRKNGRL